MYKCSKCGDEFSRVHEDGSCYQCGLLHHTAVHTTHNYGAINPENSTNENWRCWNCSVKRGHILATFKCRGQMKDEKITITLEELLKIVEKEGKNALDYVNSGKVSAPGNLYDTGWGYAMKHVAELIENGLHKITYEKQDEMGSYT